MKETIQLNIEDTHKILTIAKALSSEQRLNVLKLLEDSVLNISEIAARLQIPMSSAALHIKVLEEAGLVITQPLPGIRGSQKLSGVKVDKLYIDIKPTGQSDSPLRTAYQSIPIGNYFDFQVTAPCGMASEDRFLGSADGEAAFYLPERNQAQLIWFTQGYLEYRFTNPHLVIAKSIESIEVSMELCSEAQGFNNDWPSDITFWINGAEVGTFTSAGDFGGIRGPLNPGWWPDQLTQYGIVHRLLINQEGCFIDDVKTSGETLSSLGLDRNSSITFRLGIKEDAEYIGGLNLFGEHFGNNSQHIHVKINYIPDSP